MILEVCAFQLNSGTLPYCVYIYPRTPAPMSQIDYLIFACANLLHHVLFGMCKPTRLFCWTAEVTFLL